METAPIYLTVAVSSAAEGKDFVGSFERRHCIGVGVLDLTRNGIGVGNDHHLTSWFLTKEMIDFGHGD